MDGHTYGQNPGALLVPKVIVCVCVCVCVCDKVMSRNEIENAIDGTFLLYYEAKEMIMKSIMYISVESQKGIISQFNAVPLRTRMAEGHYRCIKSMVITPFWFSTEHHWTVIIWMLFLLWTDNIVKWRTLNHTILVRIALMIIPVYRLKNYSISCITRALMHPLTEYMNG